MEQVNMNNALKKTVYTAQEAARVLGIGRNNVYNMVRNGVIPSVKIGMRRVVIPVNALESWLNTQAAERLNTYGQ